LIKSEAVAIGVAMGFLYGLTLWTAYDSLATASFILYGDRFYIPIVSSLVITLIGFVCLFTSLWWAPRLMGMIEEMMRK